PAPRIPRHFFHQAHISEFPPRSGCGIARGCASFSAILGGHLQMVLDLFFQLFFPLPPIPPLLHDALSFFAGSNTRATTAFSRNLSTSLLFSSAFSLTRISAPPSDRRASRAGLGRSTPSATPPIGSTERR